MTLKISPDGSFSDLSDTPLPTLGKPSSNINPGRAFSDDAVSFFGGRSQPPVQASSPAEHLRAEQFGKHRASGQGQKQSGTGYHGRHSALGKHANMGTAATAQVNATPGYQGGHAKGTHAKQYNAQADINSSMSGSKKSSYVGKHSSRYQPPGPPRNNLNSRQFRIRPSKHEGKNAALLKSMEGKGK